MKNYKKYYGKTLKGHFYYKETRTDSLERFHAILESKGKSMGIDIETLKKCIKTIKKHSDTNILWTISKSGHIDIVRDLRGVYEYRETMYEILKECEYVYSVTTWKCDGYRVIELNPLKECFGLNPKRFVEENNLD